MDYRIARLEWIFVLAEKGVIIDNKGIDYILSLS